MKSKLGMIQKEVEMFGLIFLGDGATVLICRLFNILASGENIQVAVLKIADFQGRLVGGN